MRTSRTIRHDCSRARDWQHSEHDETTSQRPKKTCSNHMYGWAYQQVREYRRHQ
jgi:hypothetical protein